MVFVPAGAVVLRKKRRVVLDVKFVGYAVMLSEGLIALVVGLL